MLNKFYDKYKIRFQLDEKIDSINKNKELILSETEFKNIALVKNLLFQLFQRIKPYNNNKSFLLYKTNKSSSKRKR